MERGAAPFWDGTWLTWINTGLCAQTRTPGAQVGVLLSVRPDWLLNVSDIA